MRDLVPALPALGAVPLLAVRPASLVDVPGLAADVERRFSTLEAYCRAVGEPMGDAEFRRLDALVGEAVEALAAAPARDLAGILAKAGALTSCPAIEGDIDRACSPPPRPDPPACSAGRRSRPRPRLRPHQPIPVGVP